MDDNKGFLDYLNAKHADSKMYVSLNDTMGFFDDQQVYIDTLQRQKDAQLAFMVHDAKTMKVNTNEDNTVAYAFIPVEFMNKQHCTKLHGWDIQIWKVISMQHNAFQLKLSFLNVFEPTYVKPASSMDTSSSAPRSQIPYLYPTKLSVDTQNRSTTTMDERPTIESQIGRFYDKTANLYASGHFPEITGYRNIAKYQSNIKKAGGTRFTKIWEQDAFTFDGKPNDEFIMTGRFGQATTLSEINTLENSTEGSFMSVWKKTCYEVDCDDSEKEWLMIFDTFAVGRIGLNILENRNNDRVTVNDKQDDFDAVFNEISSMTPDNKDSIKATLLQQLTGANAIEFTGLFNNVTFDGGSDDNAADTIITRITSLVAVAMHTPSAITRKPYEHGCIRKNADMSYTIYEVKFNNYGISGHHKGWIVDVWSQSDGQPRLVYKLFDMYLSTGSHDEYKNSVLDTDQGINLDGCKNKDIDEKLEFMEESIVASNINQLKCIYSRNAKLYQAGSTVTEGIIDILKYYKHNDDCQWNLKSLKPDTRPKVLHADTIDSGFKVSTGTYQLEKGIDTI